MNLLLWHFKINIYTFIKVRHNTYSTWIIKNNRQKRKQSSKLSTEFILINLSFSDDSLLPEMILESPSMKLEGAVLVQLCCVQF